MLIKSAVFLSSLFLAASCLAQSAAPGAGHELIDVASFFNGGFPYTPEKHFNWDRLVNQIRAISQGRTINPFHRNDLRKDGSRDAILFYALAAPATIETFRVGGEDERNKIPHRIAFAVSSSPAGEFQTVAAFDVPESHFAARRPKYDFSIPVSRKISGRYLRVTLSGTNGQYRLSRFGAQGRFDRAVSLREDFNGIYRMIGGRDANTPADTAMVKQQKYTAHFPYLILHQKGSQVSGCYVYGTGNGGAGGKLLLQEISEVNGTLTGGVENNVFRFTRTHAGDGGQSQGAMALFPVAQGINRGHYNLVGHLLVERNTSGKEGEGALRVNLTRFSSTPTACAVSGQKEKSASETLAENLEKAGKVQLYGVNFDFDADTLRPESGAVLDEVVKLARANPGWKFEIGGHTDSIGSAGYNQKLSERRAASVVRYLTGKGVDAARLRARGYGASRPLVSERDGNEAARAQNRRVELVKQ
ncbi:MAG: OmpA family protein [Candidatus Accumulibacter sp.]|jgi:outer membrane protein OmpA-like peptidoglycan-associated protein|nr:OmpA family protein [Accumulibacter sp.]